VYRGRGGLRRYKFLQESLGDAMRIDGRNHAQGRASEALTARGRVELDREVRCCGPVEAPQTRASGGKDVDSQQTRASGGSREDGVFSPLGVEK
jgi:hypothetical protein